MSSEVAERYGQALFELALEENAVSEKKQEAETLLHILDENPELAGFFRAVKVQKEEKKNLIDDVFSASFDKDIVNFMKLLIDKGRMEYLKEMLGYFVAKANEELGIQTATVYSVRKLPEEDLERIKKALEIKTGKKITITNQIDERLIAGIKVVTGNNITDVSMKNRLEGMKQALLKGGQV